MAAVARYSVTHPVLDDPDLVTWDAHAARAWPTLVLVDPEGYVVAQYAGEGHAHAIDALLGTLIEEHQSRGTLQPGDSPYVAPVEETGDLRFPAKAIRLPFGNLLVANAGHRAPARRAERISATATSYAGSRSFREPNGLCLLPDDVAADVGYDVVVASTVAHQLRGITLETGAIRRLAGDGRQWMQGDDASTCRARGMWSGGRTACGSRWPASTRLSRIDPATGTVEVAAGADDRETRRADRRRRRGSPRPAAWPRTATGSGSSTPSPPPYVCSSRQRPTPGWRSPPLWGTDCSTSASGTVAARGPPPAPMASPCSPTGRSRSPTPTTAPYDTSTRLPGS